MILLLLSDKRSTALEEQETRALQHAKQVAILQQAEIEKVNKLLNRLAQKIDINTLQLGSCPSILEYAHKLDLELDNLGIADKHGDVLCFSHLASSAPITVIDRGYFQQAMTSRNFSIGQYQIDRSVHKATVNFALPLGNANHPPEYVLIAVRGLENWSKTLAHLALPIGSKVMIVDAKNQVVAEYPHTREPLGRVLSETVNHPNLGSAQLRTASNGHRHVEIQLPLGPSVTDLTLHFRFDFEHQIQSINREFFNYLSLFFIAACFMFWLTHQVLNTQLRNPLRSISNAIDKLTNEDNAQHTATNLTPSNMPKELAVIGHSFLSMLEKRQYAESKVNHKHAVLNTLLNALPDSYLRVNLNGQILDRFGSLVAGNLTLDRLLPEHIFKRIKAELAMLDAHSTMNIEFSTAEGSVIECRLHAIESHPEAAIILRDISQRKRQEEAINLAALVYNNSSECMLITDANGFILDANHAFSQVTGFTRTEVIGKTTSILSSGQHDKAFYKQMWRQLNQSGRWQGEIINRKKSGELYTEWLTIDSVYDSNQQVYRRVAIFTDITERKRKDELLWKQAHFDELTGLANRFELKRKLKSHIKMGNTFSIFLLDLDHFKDINDTQGHYFGDSLLKHIACKLNHITDKAFLSRIGGDEFVFISPHQSEAEITDFAEQILQATKSPLIINNESYQLTASIGIAQYPLDGDSAEALLKASDQAMYRTKQQGRNGYSLFDESLREVAEIRMQTLKDLRRAIVEKQFVVHYQPVVEMRTQNIVKAEALVRWQHPQKGLISPDLFIPLAEETQLIHDIGEQVFEQICHTLSELKSCAPQLQLGINVSPIQFSTKRSRLLEWHNILLQYDLSPKQCVIEVTEGMMMHNDSRTQHRVESLKSHGFEFALDDFGTGYSSLAYLKQLNCDYVKIDKRFVDGIAHNADDLTLCETIILMAHRLGLKVIAEGIETATQHQLLLQAGCDYGQGYYYDKPLDKTELIKKAMPEQILETL